MKFGRIAAFTFAAVLGLGVTGLAGCGSDSPGSDTAAPSGAAGETPKVKTPKLDPIAAVRDAADKTLGAGTSRLEMVINLESGGQSFEMTAKGAFDYAKGTGELSMTLPKSAGGGGEPIRQIITRKAVYMSGIPGIPTGKWVKIPIDQLNVGGNSGLSSSDPSAALEMLRGVSDDVTRVGEDTVRGERTTHYRGTIDIEKALANAPAEARDQVKQYLDQAGTTSVPFDLYVDDEGRLRKMVQHYKLKASGKTTAMELTVEMYDYGVKVDVKEPAASTVIDMPSGSGGGTGGG